MLRARDLGIRRGGRTILGRINAAIAPGEVVGVVGPNGAGKSTLVAALAGELSPASGTVEIDGTPVALLDPDDRARRIAVVPQATRLDFSFTARQVVALGRYPHRGRASRREDSRAVDGALARADMTALAERDFTTLSGGEQQRCILARALAQVDGVPAAGSQRGHAKVRYILADEPTASLDISHQASCIGALCTLAGSGVGVLCALHDLNLAALSVDRVIVLKAGEIVADGRPAEVLSADLVRSVFGVSVIRIDHPHLADVPQFLGHGWAARQPAAQGS